MENKVYTAITGEFEQPRTDILVFTSSHFKDSRRSARMYKCLMPEVDYTIWVDGNTSLKVTADELIKAFLQDNDIAVMPHPLRDCVYEEAQACIDCGLDDKEVIERQMERYIKDGYPEHNGLAATTYLIRKNTDKIREFNNLWWSEICRGSKRDQLSFNYCLWKLGIKPYYIGEVYPENFKNNPYFNYWQHNEIPR